MTSWGDPIGPFVARTPMATSHHGDLVRPRRSLSRWLARTARTEAVRGVEYDGAMTRDDLHRLVDALPPESLDRAAAELRWAALGAAPPDEEPLTPEESAAFEEPGPFLTWEEHGLDAPQGIAS